ncbi:MAG TPA: hypothetical protein P5077_13690 [bacterium]|nr:hypothetical protein [bacterium]
MEYHGAGVIQGAFERMRFCVAVLPVFFVLVATAFPLRAADTLPDADAVKPPVTPAADEVVLDPAPAVDKDKEEKRREERQKERKEDRKKKQQKSGKGKCKV